MSGADSNLSNSWQQYLCFELQVQGNQESLGTDDVPYQNPGQMMQLWYTAYFGQVLSRICEKFGLFVYPVAYIEPTWMLLYFVMYLKLLQPRHTND